MTLKVGIVAFHAGTNTATSSYRRRSKGKEYSPGHPCYKAGIPGTDFLVKINRPLLG